MITALKGYFFQDRHIVKRLLCFILCLLVLTITILIQQQECYAFLPALVLAPEAVELAGALLVAAGITFTAPEAIQACANWWYSSAGQQVRTQFADAVNSTVNGIAQVSDTVWQNVSSWVRSKFTTGIQTVISNYQSVNLDNGQPFPFCFNGSNTTCDIYPISSVTWQGSTWILKYTDATNPTLSINKDGADDPNSPHVQIKKGTSYYMYLNAVGTSYLQLMFRYFDINGILTYSFETILPNSGNLLTPWVSQSKTTSITATGTDVVASPTWDIKTTSGTRTVSVPSNITGLVNKSYNDVANPSSQTQSGTQTGTTVYPGHWTGTFKDCIPGMGNYVFEGTGTITGSMDFSRVGTWEGAWSWTAVGSRVWTGTYTAADSTTWTGTATEVLSQSVPFDYPNLKVPADIIKNKFPFSIPWDIKNAIASLVATPEAPKWTINFPGNIFIGGGQVVIDFAMFDTWAKILRWGLLIIFNITLILITRKVIGAGGGG